MDNKNTKTFKEKVHRIIFEADTFYGQLFDILLLFTIITSLILVMLESVASIHEKHGVFLHNFEWFVTILFTIEYILRIYSTGKPIKYIFSFYGLIDLISFAPTYLMPLFPQAQYFFVVRTFRLIRIFRILKLVRYVKGSRTLLSVLRQSTGKIVVFTTAVMILVVIMGTLMYIIERGTHGFTSIPQSIYWSIVTLTTVGYGDIVPYTDLGKILASIIMLMGYGIIAVPTGIFAATFAQQKIKLNTHVCQECNDSNHEEDAIFCKNCGHKLKL